MKRIVLFILTLLTVLQLVPFSAFAAATETDSTVSLHPLSQVWVSARKPDVALSDGSPSLRINGDAHDESFVLASFSKNQLVAKNGLELCVPVVNGAAETVVVSVIDNYTVDAATTTYNSVKDKLADAAALGEFTLVNGDNRLDLSALLGMKLSDTFTLVLRSKAIGEDDNVHSYFYDFEDYELSTDASFFKNPGSNSLKIGYLDGTTTNSLLWRGANADSNQHSIVLDPADTTGSNKVLCNYIGGTHNSSGRLRPFDAMSHDKLTTDDIGKTYRFRFRIMVTNDAGDAAAKLSMGYAEASSTTFTMTLQNQALTQTDGWQTYSVDYTIVADDIPAADAVTRTNGDRMFVFRIDGGTAETKVNWYIDDMSVVELNENGDELCAVIGEDGIRLNAEFSGDAAPTSSGYVSSALPTTVLGGREQALISGYSEDLCISYFTFRTESLGTGKYAVLDLPGHVEGSQTVDIFLADNYSVDETTLNWDKRQTLENAPLIGSGTISEDCKTLVFANPVNRITGEYFTLALCPKETYSDYVLRQDFESCEADDTVTVTTVTSALPYSDTYLFRSGGGMLNGTVADVNNNKTFAYTTNETWNRFKLYNSFSPEALTSEDAGTYRVRFRVKASDDTSIDVGVMSANGTYGSKFWSYSETESSAKSFALTANTWVTVEHDVQLTDAMIVQSDSAVGMVTVGFTEKNVQFYFDDFSISKLSDDLTENKPLARLDADLVTLRSIEINQPLADAYASEEAPTTVYGSAEELILRSGSGKSSVVMVSYLSEALRGNTKLALPLSSVTAGQNILVCAVDGVKIDETSAAYTTAQELLGKARLVGRYILGTEPLEIDLQALKSYVVGEYFTLLFVAEPAYSSLQTFEEAENSDILSSTPPSYNRCYSDSYIASVGGGGSTTADIAEITGMDGNISKVFHVNGYNRRYKFYNTISQRDLTSLDIGRKLRVTFDFMCTTDVTVNCGLKCAINGNGTTTGPEGGGYEMNTYHTKTSVTASANVWQTVSFDVTVDQEMVDHQVGLVTIDFATGTARDYYVDNIRVEEIGGNTEGTASTFHSREGDGAGFVLSGKGFVDTTDITLDGRVIVLEAEIALPTPDTESSVTDIFRIVSAEKDYALLSAENDSGKLFFEMNGTAYYLCDGKGTVYTVGETPLSVMAIYDNTRGTVRYTVGDKLAFYKDGENTVITYGLTLVEGGHVGQATASAFCEYSDVSVSVTVSKIAADAPRLVGTQTNVVGNAVRVISGIDTRYYSAIGFILERDGKQTLSWSNDYILTSVNALDSTVTAEELACQFLSCFVLSDLDSVTTGESVRIIPTAYVGNQIIKGEPMTLVFTQDNGTVSATVDTTAPDLEGYRTYTMADAEGYYRPLGRVKTEGTSLICDWSASGAEFVLDCEGDVMVTFDAGGSAGQYLTSFVDGVKCKDIVLSAGENTYTVAENLEKGTHTVRIVAQYAKKTGNMNAIKFCGELGTAETSDTYVEIIGDSITCGALLSPANGDYATAAYAYVAMSALDADYAICSRGGQALSIPTRAATFYKMFNDSRDGTLYTPARKADLIVVNLIVNDNWQWYKQNNNVVDETGTWSYENFDAGVAEFFEALEGIHDMENTPILFVFGCNTTEKSKNFTALNRLKVLFDEIYYEKYDLKTVTLTGDASASDGGHPNAEAAQLQGEELTAFILENYPTIFPNGAQ